MISRYKVVTLKRKSCIVGNLKKYSRVYKKGTVVREVPGSVGIMTFATFKRAEEFRGGRRYQKTIRVLPIGRKKNVKWISCYIRSSEGVDRFYRNKNKHIRGSSPPSGTCCYKAVRVVE